MRHYSPAAHHIVAAAAAVNICMLAEEEEDIVTRRRGVAPPTPLALARLVCHFFRDGRTDDGRSITCLAASSRRAGERAYESDAKERNELTSRRSRCTHCC